MPSGEAMTEDEQEALSFRYVMPRIMRLSSGNVALFVDGEPLRIFKIEYASDAMTVFDAIPDSAAIEAYNESLRPAPRALAPTGKLTSLNLADLGL